MATHVVYNGIELHNCITRDWNQTAMYDASGTDLIGHKFVMRFEAVMHVQNVYGGDAPQWVAGEGGMGAGGEITELAQNVCRLLEQPRRTLYVKLGDRILLKSVPTIPGTMYDSDRDVDNGPKPRNVRVMQIISHNVIRLSFTIECTKIGCNKPGQRAPTVINNRWSVSESMDDNFFTARTIAGRIRFSHSDPPAHFFKSMVIPQLEKGFKRERVVFDALETGLEATYTITDRQVFEAAPYPATKISGSHTEETISGFEFLRSVSVRLEGPPSANQALMVAQAVRVIDSRLNLLAMDVGTYVYRGAAIVKHFGESNVIEANIKIQQTPEKGVKEFLTKVHRAVAKPLELPVLEGHDYIQQESPTPWSVYGTDPLGGSRDPTVLFLLHCYLQNPCGGGHSYRQGDYQTTDGPEKPETTETEVDATYVYELPSADEDAIAEEATANIYTMARAETTYVTNPSRTQMPIARTGTSAKDLDTAVVLDLARPQCYREMHIEAERAGDWPEIPAHPDTYVDGDLKGILLKYWDRAFPPTLSADAVTRIFKVEAYYRYALNRPPRDDEPTNVGVLPFTKFSNSDNALTRSDIQQTRLAP